MMSALVFLLLAQPAPIVRIDNVELATIDGRRVVQIYATCSGSTEVVGALVSETRWDKDTGERVHVLGRTFLAGAHVIVQVDTSALVPDVYAAQVTVFDPPRSDVRRRAVRVRATVKISEEP